MTQLGLRQNWRQFVLLVIINAFVGGMVGLERTILPELAEVEFGIAARTAILSFIVVFGITKALTNYYMGALANRFGRKNLLTLGWLFGIPVPVILILAPTWSWVVAANVLLGINQGLCWSSTVVMKIDLVGERQRGLAMGFNESAGYIAVALVAALTGWIAGQYGLRPFPFYIGLVLAVLGLAGSWFLVKDTRHHVAVETTLSTVPRLSHVFRDTSWSHGSLSAISFAGMVNNMNDGMVWGLLPILLSVRGFSLSEIGVIVAVYPAVWGVGQLLTGALADRLPKKAMLFWGMVIQAIVLILFIWAMSEASFIALAVLLGVGTAIVYPTFLAAIADYTHPEQRAESIGVFRLWRDLGYAIGALLTGIIADLLGIEMSILTIGLVTLLSALVIRVRMDNEILSR